MSVHRLRMSFAQLILAAFHIFPTQGIPVFIKTKKPACEERSLAGNNVADMISTNLHLIFPVYLQFVPGKIVIPGNRKRAGLLSLVATRIYDNARREYIRAQLR